MLRLGRMSTSLKSSLISLSIRGMILSLSLSFSRRVFFPSCCWMKFVWFSSLLLLSFPCVCVCDLNVLSPWNLYSSDSVQVVETFLFSSIYHYTIHKRTHIAYILHITHRKKKQQQQQEARQKTPFTENMILAWARALARTHANVSSLSSRYHTHI